ncbi:MAG: hypothetical protein DPW16_11165 [Chloroflexi bacterium]|nr:hypothetical protein [Chloroflexota bacterium]
MRIVYTAPSANIHGGEMVCLRLMIAARDKGHTVCLIAPQTGPLTERARQETFDVFILPMQRTFQLHKAFVFARFLHQWRADLVHCHDVLPGVILERLGAHIATIPLIVHVHSQLSFNKRLIIKLIQKMAYVLTARLSGPIIAVSEDTRQGLIALGLPAQKIISIPNGVQVKEQEITRTPEDILTFYNVALSENVVGCIGRLDPAKGQYDLIVALPKIREIAADTCLVFVGEDLLGCGRYLDELKDLAIKLGLSEYVYFLGFQPNILEILSTFDLFVLPSYIEAMPLTILEAMSVAKPVIATAVNGIIEVVIQGETGLLVSPGDTLALAEAVIKLLLDKDKARVMGEAGRRRVETEFNLDIIHNRIFLLYEKVVQSNE